jgi:CheY-like chemotaxis protein
MLDAKPCPILIVEDDAGIRESMADILKDEGYDVVEAVHGAEALALLKSGVRPCLVLLDLMMPVMDGPSFRAAQQSDSVLSQIPVVIISAYREIEENARALRANGVLKKPIRLADLIATVNTYCGQHR